MDLDAGYLEALAGAAEELGLSAELDAGGEGAQQVGLGLHAMAMG